jgi:hypothetical protein
VSRPQNKPATATAADASPQAANGARRRIGGKDCIHYDGYWIRYYPPPDDTLSARKALIEHLSRRLFHHTEPGINTPGEKLDLARRTYERESNPARKRVAGAMLAGALFNRATDIFTTIVELQHKGVEISPSNELMRQCGRYFQEALELGRTVKHYSGHEGIDELWGEPFKAFTMPIDDFYASRYVKVALTMRDIDRIADTLAETLDGEAGFDGIGERIQAFADGCKLVSETMRSDPSIFEVWPQFVAAGEALTEFRPTLPDRSSDLQSDRAETGVRLLRDGQDLLTYLGGARVPMPKSTREFLDRCQRFRSRRRS